MEIAQFETEHFFAQYEFNTPYQLCNSDCETMSIDELLDLAGISVKELGRLPLGYSESQGDPELRASIASAYTSAMPDDILVLGTPVEGIYLVARALLEPEDEVIVLTPAYDALLNVFAHVVGDRNVREWPIRPEADRWCLDFDELESLFSEKTKLAVVNFPHNPTGYLPSLAELERLSTLMRKHGLWLFCDEIYAGLLHSGTKAIPSAIDVCEKSVVLSGLSKTYGLPGLRSGWLVTKDKSLRDKLFNWKFYTSICPPGPSEFLAKVALSAAEPIRQRNIEIIEKNLALAEAFFQRWSDLFTWRRPCAGSVGLIDMHVPSVTDLAHSMARDAGVLLLPAVTLGGTDQQTRMGFGRKAFGEALTQFEKYLESHALIDSSSIEKSPA